MSTFSNKVIHSKERDSISRVIKRCDEDRQCIRTPNRVDVFGTGITLPGRDVVSQAAAGPCRLQLCAVLGSSDIKLSEYACRKLSVLDTSEYACRELSVLDTKERNCPCRNLQYLANSLGLFSGH